MASWDIKYKGLENTEKLVKLEQDLGIASSFILDYTPKNIELKDLKKIRVRIFNLPEEYDARELYLTNWRRKYVCLDAELLERNYWSALQSLIHGFAHSFCHLRNEAGEEMFCEWVSFKVLEKLARTRGRRFASYICKSIRAKTNYAYANLFRYANRLEKNNPGKLVYLNSLAKRRRLSIKNEARVMRKVLNGKVEHIEIEIPELEKGFKKI